MPGTHKAEHVKLRVEDIDEAAKFYEDVFGLSEISREGGAVYFGCGFDENYDLAIEAGDPGVEHVAIRASGADEIDVLEARLEEEGVEATRTDGAEPGQETGVRFRLPSEMAVEMVTVEDKAYKSVTGPALPDRGNLAPVDFNHVSFLSPCVKRDAEFLRDVLDFKISETVHEDWSGGAFLRRGPMHHDVAIFDMPGTPEDHASFHHSAFTLRGLDHLVALVDALAAAGTRLEFGLGRHHAGDNIYGYVRAPDGHRIELNVQMAELDEDTPTKSVDDLDTAVWAWKEDPSLPDSFVHGSGLVR